MRIIILLFLLLGLAQPALAQSEPSAPAASQGDIDALVRILENDESRALLITRLQQTAAGDPAVEPAADLSIARRLAEYTRAVAEGTSATIAAIGDLGRELQQGFSGTLEADFTRFRDVAIGVLLVGAGLFGSFIVLQILVLWLQGRIANRIAGRRWPVRVSGMVGAAALNAASVVLAWGIGYVVALAVGNEAGRMGINQTLLLNAFLVVEGSKLVVRTILSPRQAALRPLPVTDSNAAYWSFWLGREISLLGYTFMFVAPVLAANLSRSAAAAAQVLVMLTAVIIGIIIVLQCRAGVRAWLTQRAARRKGGYGQFLLLVGHYWHLVAIAYLVALLVVWFANPDRALPFMIGATVQSALVILVGMLVVGFISRFVGVGLVLPPDVKQRLPLLEARLHAFVPRIMQVVSWIVIIVVLMLIAQAWHLFDFVGWISSDTGQQLVGSIVSAALIILVCIVLHVVVASWVEYRLNTNAGRAPTAREKTLLSLFRNAFTIALVIFGVMLALAQIGVNIAPLLAGAGVIGLAIGFGAQKLVEDIITGIFIQFENIMNEGDTVEVAGKSGTVEKLTIRSVTIRDMSGTIHLVPFSAVAQVSNMVRGFSFYVAEFEVSRDADIEMVKQAMHDAFDQVMQTEHRDVVLDELDLQGLIAITPASMSLRARIKTLAGKQWGPGRLYSETVMRLFDERGIATPTTRVSYVPGRQPELLPPAAAAPAV